MSTPIKQFRIVGKKGKIVKSTAQTKPARKTRKATKTSKLKLGPQLQREVTQAKRALSRIQAVRAQLSQDETVANPRPLNSTDIRFSNEIILLRDQLNNLIVELNENLPPRQQMTLSSVLAQYGVSPVRPTFAELQSVFNNLIEQRDAKQSLEASKELLQLKKDQIERGKDASLVPKIASRKKTRDPSPPLPPGGHSGLDVTLEEMSEPVPYDLVVPPRQPPKRLDLIDLSEPIKGTPKRELEVLKFKQKQAEKSAKAASKRSKSAIERSKQFRKNLKKGGKPTPPKAPSETKAEISAAWDVYKKLPTGTPESTKALKEYVKLTRKERRRVRSIPPIAQPIFASTPAQPKAETVYTEFTPGAFATGTPAAVPAVRRRIIVPPDDSGISSSPGASYEEMAEEQSGIPLTPLQAVTRKKRTSTRSPAGPSKLGQFVETAATAQAGEGFIVPYSAKRVKNLRTAMGHAERGHFAKALRLIHTQRKMVRDPTHQAEMYVQSLMAN